MARNFLRALHRVGIALVVCLCMFVPLNIGSMVAVGKHFWLISGPEVVIIGLVLGLILSVLAVCFVIVPVRYMLRGDGAAGGWFERVFMGLFCGGSLFYLGVLAWLFAWSAPLYFAVAAVVAWAAARLARRERLAGPLFFVVFAGVAVSVVWVKAFAVIPLAYLLLLRAGAKREVRLTFGPVFSGLGLLMALMWFFSMTQLSDPAAHKRVLRQPGVSPIIISGQGRAWEMSGKKLRFVLEDCAGEHYLIGARGTPGGRGFALLRVDKQDPDHVEGLMPGTAEAPDRVAVDCERNLLFYGDYKTGWMHIISLDDFKEVQHVRGAGYPITNTVLDTERGVAYSVVDYTETVVRMDYSDLPRVRTKVARNSSSDVAYADGRVLLTSQFTLDALGGASLRRLRHRAFRAPNPDFKIVAAADGRIYGTNLLTGNLLVLDGENFALIGSRRLAPGVRFLAYDAARRRIYVANFLSGVIYFVEADGLRVIRKVFVGRRARALYISRDGRSLLATSAAGAFRIEL